MEIVCHGTKMNQWARKKPKVQVFYVVPPSFHLATVRREYLSDQIIIFTYYYNRNETETIVVDQLKQASNNYYPSWIYRIDENYLINTNLQAQGYSSIRPLPKVTIADYWHILQLFDLCS